MDSIKKSERLKIQKDLLARVENLPVSKHSVMHQVVLCNKFVGRLNNIADIVIQSPITRRAVGS